MIEQVFPVVFSSDIELSNRELFFYASLLPAVFLVRGVSGYLNNVAINFVGIQFVRQLRESIFNRLQHQQLGFLSKYNSGELHARLTQDTQLVQTVISESLNDLVRQPMMLIGSFVILTYLTFNNQNVLFILLACATVPVCILPIRFLSRRILKKAQKQQSAIGDLSGAINENFAASREVRAYNLEEQAIKGFRERMAELAKVQFKVIAYHRGLSPMVEFISAVGVGLALYFAARGDIGLETFMAMVSALYFSYDPVKKLGLVSNNFQKANSALDRIESLTDAEIEIVDNPNGLDSLTARGAVSFQNVSFAYGNETVLDSVSVDIAAGTQVAVVGPSGAGKTTFINLISRFYEPSYGSITLDDIALPKMRLKALRENIGLVPQEPVLFQESLLENIRLGRPDASDEEVIEAAKVAQIHAFIESCPDGYNTLAGERGALLSGGQKQRIALARAFLRNAPILLLDEATSALDSESEKGVQKALAEISKGKTVFTIAHRFSTIKDADRVLLFDQGKIVADGSFDDLLKHPLFKSLYDNQNLSA